MLLKHILSSGSYEIPGDWVYRGEGNANVVISLKKTHQILRIRKKEKPTTILGRFINWLTQLLKWDCTNEINKESRDLQFYTLVMRKLLGENYVCVAKQVYISRGQIQELDKNIMKYRPDFRRKKCLQYGRVTLFQDYAFLPEDLSYLSPLEATYSIEIKPKQGWVPYDQRSAPKCTYCLNQYLKLEKGQIKRISSYCPLDLFSGVKSRMRKALENLVENPQNNFRVFRDGIYAYGENMPTEIFVELIKEWFKTETDTNELLEECFNLMQQILLKEFQKDIGCERCKNQHYSITHDYDVGNHNKCDYTSQNLPKGCVLERILSVQRFDDGRSRHYYKKVKKEDTWGYVDEILKEICKDLYHCPNCVINSLRNSEKLDFVPYLIAAVARDCSLMLTFKRINDCDNNFNIINTRFGNFIANVGIFDLYPKPSSIIEKHQKRNKRMCKVYESFKC